MEAGRVSRKLQNGTSEGLQPSPWFSRTLSRKDGTAGGNFRTRAVVVVVHFYGEDGGNAVIGPNVARDREMIFDGIVGRDVDWNVNGNRPGKEDETTQQKGRHNEGRRKCHVC